MDFNFFSNSLYIILLIVLLTVCCYLFYLRHKNRRTSFVPSEELIRSKTELKETLRKHELALRSINFGLVYIDKDFCVQWETTTNIQQLVTNHKYIPGLYCYDTTGLEKEACVDCPFKAAVSLGKMAMRLIYVDNMYFEITATPVYDHPDELIGGLLRIEDVTEKIRLNNSLREAKEKAEEANRLKTAFLANISHEIRTPLNAILGFSDMICKTEEEDTRQGFHKIIQTNSDMLLHLIDNVLDLSKIEAGRMDITCVSTDMNQFMKELLIQLQQKNTNADVEFGLGNPQQEECVVHIDKVKVAQVMSNLVGNALKFTSRGSVSMGYRLNEDKNELYMYVKDTGIGIPEDKQEIIFERFVKLDPFVKGVGIGLSICRNIVSGLGGTIGVESEEGKGSCFWFRIPTKYIR